MLGSATPSQRCFVCVLRELRSLCYEGAALPTQNGGLLFVNDHVSTAPPDSGNAREYNSLATFSSGVQLFVF